ncbi:MAG: CHAT domain-containing protein [Gammaproteobacteria bacterium]|nr:CHAT domain-containing protein [Gammaproteobacteria bacterium]
MRLMLVRVRACPSAVFFTLFLSLATVLSSNADPDIGEEALRQIINARDVSDAERFDGLTRLAYLYRNKGFKRRALPLLQEARRLSIGLGDADRQRVHILLGGLLFDLGSYTEAQDVLQPLLDETKNKPSLTRARALNELAMVYGLTNNHEQAVQLFDEGIVLAESLGVPNLEARISVNRAKSLLTLGEIQRLSSAFNALDKLLRTLPSGSDKAEILIAAANVRRGAYWYFDFSPNATIKAYEHLIEAGTIAEQVKNPRLLSYARGYLGRLYEDDNAFDSALALSREAAFHANSVQAYESAYLWEWQIGRIQNKLGKTTESIMSYEQALSTLEHVRQDLIDGSPYTFHQKVQPLFTELSDILLTSARALPVGEVKQAQLSYVQEVLEQVKSAELQDYFQNDCVLPETSVELDQVEPGTATIYPVILPDRLEMLVSIGGTIHQFISPIEVDDLNSLVHEFRDQLQVDFGDNEYQEIGEELYELVIAPFEDLLARKNVETLLFVPDGVFRTVPISALFDGEKYLIEKYAIATTPGLKLTLPKPLELSDSNVFAGGISEAVQGFTGLPGVPQELENLRKKYGASVLSDAQFSMEVVAQEMASEAYSIVHIATHGHFDSNPEKSFLLAYDGKITMNMLEKSIGYRKYLGDPLELLVLSACETAAGDNRAALGLAGVALKAGARSAVATLWQISDAATVRLIDSFYVNFSTGKASKAVALQIAQIALIEDEDFAHPSDWAPFLLIGNWL